MSEDSRSTTNGGIGIGAVVAAILSWHAWHSIGWAILHACFGWGYIAYYLIEYGWPK